MKYSKNGQKFAMSKNASNMLFETCWTPCKKPHFSMRSRLWYTFFWMTRYKEVKRKVFEACKTNNREVSSAHEIHFSWLYHGDIKIKDTFVYKHILTYHIISNSCYAWSILKWKITSIFCTYRDFRWQVQRRVSLGVVTVEYELDLYLFWDSFLNS